MPNIKTIVGAGGKPQKKKGFPRRAKQMPKYPDTGSQKLPDKKPKIGSGSMTLPDKKPGNTYYLYDKNYNKGWLPGGADNPITTYAKGIIKITTGIDIPNMKSWEDRNRSNNKTKLNP